jgi:hypothetical protein
VRKYEVFRQKMLAAASGANDKMAGDDNGKETAGGAIKAPVKALLRLFLRLY